MPMRPRPPARGTRRRRLGAARHEGRHARRVHRHLPFGLGREQAPPHAPKARCSSINVRSMPVSIAAATGSRLGLRQLGGGRHLLGRGRGDRR